MFQEIINQLVSQSTAEWIVLITGVIYIIFSMLNKSIGWVFGIISCGILTWVTFVKYDLWADAVLQAFYVVMGFIGLWNWQRGGANQSELATTHLQKNIILRDIGIGILIALPAGFILDEYTPAAATHWDSFTTVFSIIATFWLIKRKVETWVLWIIVDFIYIGLYYSRGGILFATLYVIFWIISIIAFIRWKRQASYEIIQEN